MWSLRGKGLVASYIDHSMLVAIAWARLLLFGFLLGALLGFRDQLPGSEPLLYLTFAFGLYNLVVAMFLKNQQDGIARWVGGSLDTLTVMLAMALLTMSSAPSQTTQIFVSLSFLLVILGALIHFGIVSGVAISIGIAGWYLLVQSLGAGYLGGLGGLLPQAPLMIVFGGIVAAISQHVSRVNQARPDILPRPNKQRELPPPAPGPASPGDAPRALPSAKRIRLYISEEQSILRKAYETFFPSDSRIEIVEVSAPSSGQDMAEAAAAINPDVMLLGFKILDPDAVEKLEEIRERCPKVPLVILSTHYTVRGVSALREFSRGSSVSCAYLLKHTVDTADELAQVIWAVAQGRIVLDWAVMDGLVGGSEPGFTLLQDLSSIELDILKWMSKGYQDQTIAGLLHLDPSKLKRHVNSLYRKIGDCPATVDNRVYAITLYLKATGALIPQPLG